MNDALRCPFCGHDADGLTLYSSAGVFRLLVCESCYGLLVAKAHQPHSRLMQRLHRLLGLKRREVVAHAGPTRRGTAPAHSRAAVTLGPAQERSVPAAEPAIGSSVASDNNKEHRRCAS